MVKEKALKKLVDAINELLDAEDIDIEEQEDDIISITVDGYDIDLPYDDAVDMTIGDLIDLIESTK